MLRDIKGMTMTTVCHSCGKKKQTDLTGITIHKNEFNEWDNFVVECDCGAGQAFNLNIAENDTDEPFATGELPVNEEIQRYYIRLLQRIVREDFQK